MKLDALFKYPFFQSCGVALQADVLQVRDWTSAAKNCDSRKWGNCRLVASNALYWAIQNLSWDRSQEWNPLADELRTLIGPFVANLLRLTSVPIELQEKIKPKLCWDIMHICFEYQHLDLMKPIFFIPYLEGWFGRGHFPCGWDGGEFPEHWDGVIRDGRLMVF